MKLEKSMKDRFHQRESLLKEFVEERRAVGSSSDAIEWFANKKLKSQAYISFPRERLQRFDKLKLETIVC